MSTEFVDGLGGRSFTHNANWETVAPEVFLGELFAPFRKRYREHLIRTYSSALSPVANASGENVGRAAINLELNLVQYADIGFVSVGGLVHTQGDSQVEDERGSSDFFVGVLAGDTSDASRKGTVLSVPRQTLANWASRQAENLDRAKFTPMQLVPIAQTVQSLAGDPGGLPYCFLSGRLVSTSELTAYLQSRSSVYLLVKFDYRQHPQWDTINELGPDMMTSQLKEGIAVVLLNDERGRTILGEGRQIDERSVSASIQMTGSEEGFGQESMTTFIDIVRKQWGSFSARLELMQIFDGNYIVAPQKRLVVILDRPLQKRS